MLASYMEGPDEWMGMYNGIKGLHIWALSLTHFCLKKIMHWNLVSLSQKLG